MKTRLTITLPADLLSSIDNQIDGSHLRNRSHAIEHLIRQSLGLDVSTAVILSGGEKNIKHNTLLKKINGQFLLSIIIDQLKPHGITDIFICAPDKNKDVEREFGTGAALNVSIKYVYEKKPLGTAGALKHAAAHTSSTEPWLVMHGDVLIDLDLGALFEFHRTEGAEATITVKPKLGNKALGEVYLSGNQVLKFSKHGSEQDISIINTGVYVIEPQIISQLPNASSKDLEIDVFPQLARTNQLKAFIYQGIWYDISTEDQYLESQKRWKHVKRS
ncbi:MAG: sugar phosphate nucleotidyltransferase [Patescibacteria group bacterium]